jgi:hypothetical protein
MRASDVEVPPRALEILAEWTTLDRALYAHARRLVAERREESTPGPRAALPRPAAYRFDQPIHGTGWCQREHDAFGWFCWTGGTEESVLHFEAPEACDADYRLMLTVAYILQPEALEEMRLSVNGEPTPFHLRPGEPGAVVEARLSAAVLARGQGRLVLALRPGCRSRPSDLDPASTDNRWLGLSLRRVDLHPI